MNIMHPVGYCLIAVVVIFVMTMIMIRVVAEREWNRASYSQKYINACRGVFCHTYGLEPQYPGDTKRCVVPSHGLDVVMKAGLFCKGKLKLLMTFGKELLEYECESLSYIRAFCRRQSIDVDNPMFIIGDNRRALDLRNEVGEALKIIGKLRWKRVDVFCIAPHTYRVRKVWNKLNRDSDLVVIFHPVSVHPKFWILEVLKIMISPFVVIKH